jgi:hypothetical protein
MLGTCDAPDTPTLAEGGGSDDAGAPSPVSGDAISRGKMISDAVEDAVSGSSIASSEMDAPGQIISIDGGS